MNAFEVDKYERLLTDLLTEQPDIDGLFLNSDLMALVAMTVCRKLGKRIPEDVKLVGYDDVLLASLTSPQITTIRQPLDKMSELAVQLLKVLSKVSPLRWRTACLWN
jgi:LacI family sucrose operon transcriptional repressor